MKHFANRNDVARSAGALRAVALVAIGGWLALAAGCHDAGKADGEEKSPSPSFLALFATNCAGCHGADGKLGPAPPLNDDLFRALVSTDELTKAISSGRQGTPMPAFALKNGGELSDEQIATLVAGIKGTSTTEKSAEKPAAPASASGAGWSAVKAAPKGVPRYALTASGSPTSDELESIRKTAFARACASCHGASGQGGKMAGAINGPEVLALISDQALRRLVITGRPDLGMPDYAERDGRSDDYEPLTDEETTKIVELLHSWREGSAATGAVAQLNGPTSGQKPPGPQDTIAKESRHGL